MVAVALLPPAVASGILLGEGELRGAFAALLARRSARLGVAIFVVLLIALAALVVAAQTFGGAGQTR